MADVLRVQPGYAPWAPASDASLTKEYHYHDFPRAGVVEQHGVRYFFFVAGSGPEDVVSFWLYIHLDPAAEASFDASTPESFYDSVSLGGHAVVALAIEGVGIVTSQLVEEVSDPEQLRSASDALVRRLNVWADDAQELELA